MLLIISTISLLLLIWFRSDAWVEYCRLFRFDSISFYKDFDEKKHQDVSLTYHIYLRRYHNCFFIRMITCPICFGVWFGILACLYQLIAVVHIPLVVLASLFIYGLIDRLLG